MLIIFREEISIAVPRPGIDTVAGFDTQTILSIVFYSRQAIVVIHLASNISISGRQESCSKPDDHEQHDHRYYAAEVSFDKTHKKYGRNL